MTESSTASEPSAKRPIEAIFDAAADDDEDVVMEATPPVLSQTKRSKKNALEALSKPVSAPSSAFSSPEKPVLVPSSNTDELPASQQPTPNSRAKVSTKRAKKQTSSDKSTTPQPKSEGCKPVGRKAKTPDTATKRGRPAKAAGKNQTTLTAHLEPTVRASWQTVTPQGAQPAERWGHTVTKISDDRVVVYGGANDAELTLGDLHVLDLKTQSWSQPLNCESIPRTWHDAVYLENKHLMLVFGGERMLAPDQRDVLADIMVLDTECFLWYPPAVSGAGPKARYDIAEGNRLLVLDRVGMTDVLLLLPNASRSGHTCTIVGDDMVLFSGSQGRNRQSTVYVLDTNEWHWKNVKIEGKPPNPCTYHSAIAITGDRIVYFGGNDMDQCFNSVHVLQKKPNAVDTWAWFHPCVTGTPPRARTGHSATLVGDAKADIFICGGWDPQREDPEEQSVFQDAFLLHTTTWQWEAVPVNRPSDADASLLEALPARVGHRVVADDTSKQLYFFGGQDVNEQRLDVIHSVTLEPAGAATAEPEAEQKPGSTEVAAVIAL